MPDGSRVDPNAAADTGGGQGQQCLECGNTAPGHEDDTGNFYCDSCWGRFGDGSSGGDGARGRQQDEGDPDWLHEKMSKADAEELIGQGDARTGAFLVRTGVFLPSTRTLSTQRPWRACACMHACSTPCVGSALD